MQSGVTLEPMPAGVVGITNDLQRHVYNSFHVVGKRKRRCSRVIAGVTVFITRIEYFNLYHQSADW